MARFFLIFSLLLLTSGAWAQSYWQQHVAFDIEVTLDDQNHFLHGQWAMDYTNHSPDTLEYIYMHLWPNAYSSGETPLALQLLENGNKSLYYAEVDQRGWIDNLHFEMGGQPCTLEMTEADVGLLYLPEPILPETTVRFNSPFLVKLPGDFSRLGHDGHAYQISQWYPKPAVYDHKGWHPMAYLDQGEFYSEFGEFRVRITLPENYVVGATGVLQNAEERAWLLAKADSTNELLNKKDLPDPVPVPSSGQAKTLEYFAENVHDFAWFADKRYLVQHDTAQLESGKVVDVWSMFTSANVGQWAESTNYIKRALHFYSGLVGPYPYPQCTAVEGTLSAGAGMEYPMITILGEAASQSALERVTIHEVGHNWFYAALGSNERLHPWMDEGINSYYEFRYFKELYPAKTLLPDEMQKSGQNFLGLSELREEDLYRKIWVHQHLVHESQPLDLPSTEYSLMNYGLGVYAGTAFLLEHLAAYLGKERFDRAMQAYFQKWNGRHPYPEDFFQVFEQETGESLDWAFRGQLSEGRRQDFKFGKVVDKRDACEVETKDATKSGAPYPVQIIHGDSVVAQYWVQGDTVLRIGKLPRADHLAIDHHRITFDLNRGNNTYRFTGLWKKTRKPAIRWLGGLEEDNIQAIYYTAVAGWNNYDRWMAGLALYNSLFPQRSFHFRAAALYGFGSKSIVGAATVEQDIFFNRGLFHRWQLSLAGQSFHDDIVRNQWLRYVKLNPSLTLYFRKPSVRSPSQHGLTISSTHINRERLRFQSANEFEEVNQTYNFQRLTYHWKRKSTLSPFTQEVTLERHNKYLKLWWDGRWRISNDFLRSDIRVRTFAGAFLTNRLSEPGESIFEFSLSNTTGRLDYGYENLYLGRTDQSGLTYMQQYTGGGGMKVRTDKFPYFGLSGEYLASVNVTVPLPLPLLSVFGDLAVMPVVGGAQWFTEAGIAIVLVPEVAEIYLPIVMDKSLRGAFVSDTDNYVQRITFLLNLNRLNPLKTIRSFSLNDF